MAINKLDDIAHGYGYESMWQAAEATRVSQDIPLNQIDELNDAIANHALADTYNADTGPARTQVTAAMGAIHAGRTGLAAKVIANWQNQ